MKGNPTRKLPNQKLNLMSVSRSPRLDYDIESVPNNGYLDLTFYEISSNQMFCKRLFTISLNYIEQKKFNRMVYEFMLDARDAKVFHFGEYGYISFERISNTTDVNVLVDIAGCTFDVTVDIVGFMSFIRSHR